MENVFSYWVDRAVKNRGTHDLVDTPFVVPEPNAAVVFSASRSKPGLVVGGAHAAAFFANAFRSNSAGLT